MEKQNKFLFLMIFIYGILFIGIVSSTYQRTAIQYTAGTSFSGGGYYNAQGEEQCKQNLGQDIIIQVTPFGCSPPLVRSDLLEEQDQPVFCKLSATKINPLIQIKAIDNINFPGKMPEGVKDIAYLPSKAALGRDPEALNSPFLNDIGYAIIVLKQNKNESSMPELIEGEVTARLHYDIKNAFGMGDSSFYLPQIDDEKIWKDKREVYSFWNGRGYVRAESISVDSASIGVYSGDRKISSNNLKIGQESSRIYLRGFDCNAGLTVKLNELVVPDTRARINVNGDVMELGVGEKFLGEACVLNKVDRVGLVEEVVFSCRDNPSKMVLRVNPSLKIKINNEEKMVGVGDKIGEYGGNSVYLAFVGKKVFEGDNRIYAYFISHSSNVNKLPEAEFNGIVHYDWSVNSQIAPGTSLGILADVFKKIGGVTYSVGQRALKGQEISFAAENIPTNINGMDITILGLGNPYDAELSEEAKINYLKALEDYDAVINGYANTIFPDDGVKKILKGEEAFKAKILLANSVQQKKTLLDFCREFKAKYPESKLYQEVKSSCENDIKISSSELSSNYVSLNGLSKEISLEGIYDPSYEEYGAEIFVSSQNVEPYTVTKPIKKDETITFGVNEYLTLEKIEGNQAIFKIDNDGSSQDLTITISNSAKIYGKYDVKFSKITREGGDGVEVEITYPPVDNQAYAGMKRLTKNSKVFISDNEFISLVRIDDNFIVLDASKVDGGISSLKIDLDKYQVVGKNKYSIKLTKVNLKKLAKVSVSNIKPSFTEANFTFKIGIEKRGIQLSPSQIKKRLETLNKTIEDLEDKTNKLGSIVKGLKTACFATGGVLTVKNFLANRDGKAIARQQVMRGPAGWYVKCSSLSRENPAEYPNIDKCLTKNSEAIERDVNAYYSKLKESNDLAEQIGKDYEDTGLFGQKVINDKTFGPAYLNKIRPELKTNLIRKFGGNQIDIQTAKINIDEFVNNLDTSVTPVENIRDLYLHSSVEGDVSLNEMMKTTLLTEIKEIHERTKEYNALKAGRAGASSSGLPGVETSILRNQNTKEDFYDGYVAENNFMDIKKGDPIRGINYLGMNYYLKLKKIDGSSDTYSVVDVYDVRGKTIPPKPGFGPSTPGFEEIPDEVPAIMYNLYFKKYDPSLYNNEFSSSFSDTVPVLRYYDNEPYKGYPAIVPFDLKKGWYVAISQTFPVGGNIRSFDDSGRVNSFSICNVGRDHIEQNKGGDDLCRLFVNGQSYDNFHGLDDTEIKNLVDSATKAVYEAQRFYESGGAKTGAIATINGVRVKVGAPAVDIPDIQCADVYSAKECQLLFNVCDPVICPNSRCNLGGAYQVEDVIQTGVVGSVALCLPNFPQVYIPICLSGVHAGLDAWLSVQRSYQQCLQENLNTGQTIGICDEIYSLYQCEFFWRQGIPIIKYAAPKAIEVLTGQNVKGGGEYLGVRSAWDNAQKSVDFFTQYYAENSFKAFKMRSAEEFGGEICKTFVSAAYPSSGNIIDKLTKPDSPTQFYARFDEIPYTSATNPPISHYKVFYHIYAGNDRGAYFKVYLKGDKSSFYEDSEYSRAVPGASGYIAAGGFAQNTPDFTAPAGYKELCVVVNEQVECGFKEVTTDFGLNYIKEKYVAEQAKERNIKTTKECVAGSSSLHSMINPNLQEGVTNTINPSISNSGLTRICSTNCPSENVQDCTSESSNWVPVGYCDTPNVKCWLDESNVADIIKNANIENDVLSEAEKTAQEVLQGKEIINDDAEFNSEIEEIVNIADVSTLTPREKIDKFTQLLTKAYFNKHKGQLFYLRGNEYGSISLMTKIADDAKKIKTLPPVVNCGDGGVLEFVNLSVFNKEQVDAFRKEVIRLGAEESSFVFTKYGADMYVRDKNDPCNKYFIILPDGSIDRPMGDIVPESADILFGDETKALEVSEADIRRAISTYPEAAITFEFKDGNSFSENVYYRYINGWYFSDNNQDWVSISVAKQAIKEGTYNSQPGQDILSNVPAAISRFSSLSDENKEFTFSLVHDNIVIPLIQQYPSKSYSEGLNLLLARTISDNEGNGFLGTIGDWTGGSAELDSPYVKLNSEQLFTIKLGNIGVKLFNDGWKWTIYDNAGWLPFNEVSISKLPVEFKVDGITLSDLGDALEGKDFYNGSEVMFDLNVGSRYWILRSQRREGVAVIVEGGGEEPGEFTQRLKEDFDKIINAATISGLLSGPCIDYSDAIIKSSQDNLISDPLLLLALMYKESSCNSKASSESSKLPFDKGASYGLMQISGNTWCGNFGLPPKEQKDDCVQILLNDPTKNIDIGSKILKSYYRTSPKRYKCGAFRSTDSNTGKTIQNEPAVDKEYTGWEHALRRYNGWGCAGYRSDGSEIFADQDYVEKIRDLYKKLVVLA
ncbi:MAG TPA: transglycosylase SLT domain-containing protein [Candidatus Nanoarchaeia archaeon]|nr:transglycosylase SLT domain-containing protein [Candidatus Nanoarchaeia archaeon]